MKAIRCRKRRLFLIANKLVSLITLIFFSASTVFALPAGQQVVNGQAAFNTQGNNLTITNSPNAIINWQRFSINSNEAVRFIQQSSASAVLNRIIGQDPSRILGLLQSNGRVFLINPNGILFGQGARIDVNGLVASTLNISNQDFLAGKYNFTAGAFAGSIQNQGTITTPAGGKVYLIAPDIENSGIINSPKGDVILAAGHSVQLVDSLDPDISVVVSAPENKAVNLGQIVAQSGKVGIYGGLILQKGIVNANSAVVGENGRIFFMAKKDVTIEQGSVTSAQGGGTIKVLGGMDSGTVTVNGALDASAPNGGDGGFIETSAAHVRVSESARITTLAPYGNAGLWLIDPTDYTIAATDPLNGSSYMSNTTLSTNLASTPIVIQTLASGSGNGDIFVNDVVSWSNANTLTLKAHNNININAPITNTFMTFGEKVILRADLDANGTGTVAFGGPVGAGAGSVNTAGYGTVSLYYNPASYSSPNDYPGKISTPFDAYMLVNNVNNLQAMNTNLAGAYALGKDIDASATSGWNGGKGFLPIGDTGSPAFSGKFNGDGHAITGLTINRPSGTNYVGLFGYNSGVVRNIGVVNGNITGYNDVGGLAGWNTGSISNSYYTGALTGGSTEVGGLVGCNKGSISNSYTAGTVTNSSNYVGGLVGNNYVGGTISNSYSTAAVTGNYAGGLVGCNITAGISNSYSTGAVSGTNVGGMIGLYSSGTITNSYWDKDTSGQITSGSGTGKTTAEMMTQATFTGWDFTTTWWISGANTRPFLRSEYSTNIINAHQLQLMGMNATTLGASYTLAGNIDMSELTQASGLWNTTTGFVPVGNATTKFTGAFEGNSNTITGLKINRPTTDYVSLFGYTDTPATIRNVGLVNVNITGDRWVGGLAGENDGAIDNSTSTGTVSGSNSSIGGLVGDNYGSISNSSSTATVSGSSFVGGLVGDNQFGGSIINSSYTMGTVTGSSNYVGGLVGWNEGTIDSSSSTGAVIDGSNYVGGLVGLNQNDGGISNSNSSSAVIGDSFVGGLAGENDGTISNSYSTGTVTGTGDLVGGLVGVNNAIIENNSYSTGNVIGNSYVGGLVGGNYALGFNGASISDSSSTGTVTGTGTYEGGTDAYVGGLVGFNDTSSTINSSYHNTGAVTGVGYYVGGLVGKNLGAIDGSWNEGTVVSSSDYVGGLVGRNEGSIGTSSYNTGIVIGGSNYVGGLVGWNDTSGSITSSYSTGAVTGVGSGEGEGFIGSSFVGGLVGKNLGGIGSSWNEGTVIGTGDFVGGLVGWNDTSAIIDTSYSSGTVTGGGAYDGGLAGWNDGIIDSSWSESTVNGTGDFVGGLAGVNYISGSIISSHSTGTVSGTGNIVGGLAGYNQGSISSSFHSMGTVSGVGQVGGLVGGNSGTGGIDSSYNTGAVSGTGLLYVGGLVGLSAGSISNSYNAGAVTGVGQVGGLVGSSIGSIANSYSTGSVSGTGDYVGGLAGVSGGAGSSITNSYSTGAVSGAGSNIGGLVGFNSSTITSSYWDTQTSGQAASAGGTGLTTAQMTTLASFVGWDFATTWGITQGTTYPYLRWQSPGTYPVPPGGPQQTISGMLDVALAGKVIYFYVDGTLFLGQTTTIAGGLYSIALSGNPVSSNKALLAYVYNDTVKGASVYLSGGGNITNLDIYSNILIAGSGGGTVSNTTLGVAKGVLTSSDIPYSVLVTDLTLSPDFNFKTASGTTYSINGNITTTNGSQAYNGPVTLPGNAVIGAGTGNISFGGAVTGAGYNLTLNTTGTVSQTAPITVAGLELLGAGAIYTLTNAGNAIATLAGNTGTVNFTNNTGLSIGTVNTTTGLATSGDLTLNNVGAITTDSSITTSGGTVSITAHSPLTIGPGGVSANGNITLEASPTQTTDDLTINGMVSSSTGNIILRAGSSIILGAGGILNAPNGTITLSDGLNGSSAAPASPGNAIATNDTLVALKTTEGTTIATVETTSDSDEKEDEERKKKKEGGEQTTDDNKKDDKGKKYCN